MKKYNFFKIMFFSIFLNIFCWGCTSEYNLATRQEETLLYGSDKEVQIGANISAKFDKEFTIISDIDVNERVQNILDRIIAVCDRKDIVYTIKVVEEDQVNAVSLPGGYIYIFKGLIDKVDTDDELAGVIAHEVGHITAKHGIKKLQSIYGYMLLQVVAVQTGDARVAQGIDTIFGSVFLQHSRQDEFLADRLAVKYTKKAGYNPQGVIGFLEKLKKEGERSSPKEFSYWRTHPHISERMSSANQAITGQLEFKDYLNLLDYE